LALAFGLHDKHVISLAMRMRLQLILPVVAVGLSVAFPSALLFRVTGGPISPGVWMSPLRLVFLAAMFVYLHGLWTYRHAYFAAAVATCFAAAGLGVSAPAIWQSLQLGWGASLDLGRRLVPRTGTHWGVLSVVSSFVLLALGVLSSVIKSRHLRSSMTVAWGGGSVVIASSSPPGGGGNPTGQDRSEDPSGEDQLMV
jgi:hypothetical protein